MNAEESLSFPQEYYLTLKGSTYSLDTTPTEKYLIAFDQAGAKQIAKIYITYLTLQENKPKLEYEIKTLKELNDISDRLSMSYKNSLLECKATLEGSEADRSFVYEAYEEIIKNQNKLARKKKIITIFSSIGGGLAGIGIGVLIGIFAI